MGMGILAVVVAGQILMIAITTVRMAIQVVVRMEEPPAAPVAAVDAEAEIRKFEIWNLIIIISPEHIPPDATGENIGIFTQ